MNELQNQAEIQFINVHFKKVGDSFDSNVADSQEPLAVPVSTSPFQFPLSTADVFDALTLPKEICGLGWS